jgi:hypothetical protein
LLVVDYDVGQLDVQNRSHQARQLIELHAHRQTGAAPAAITSLVLSVSFDEGSTWQDLSTQSAGNGRYRAEITNPASAQNVSIRVQATDSGGSSIDQTIIRAYGLD